ncbi:unnamed protein product [marine sediment metagenome]|uniref:Uncharacterized protein n=1 Tax=marine sediment metagenome TaxID=412755 RepID=X0ZA93_9ZZZZ
MDFTWGKRVLDKLTLTTALGLSFRIRRGFDTCSKQMEHRSILQLNLTHYDPKALR